MAGTERIETALAERAREWHHASHRAVCDSIERWEHGAVLRASRYPTYYSFNLVRVEDEPEMSVAELASFAEQALGGLEHRRIDFEDIDAGEARRRELMAFGWKLTRLVWMAHQGQMPPAEREMEVEEVPYDAVQELRLSWHLEDFD